MSELGVYTFFVILATLCGVGAILNVGNSELVTTVILIVSAIFFGTLAYSGYQEISGRLSAHAQRVESQ